MSDHRSFRPRVRVAVMAIAAVMTVAAVSEVKLNSAPATQRIADAAAVSQASAAGLCSTSGPGGTWMINGTEIATLPAPGSAVPTTPCTTISLPDATQASQIQQCASKLENAQQEVNQQASSILFSEFMQNMIQNNAGQWASALTANGYQGPSVPASSQEVSDAINQVATTSSNVANAITQAIIAMVKSDFDSSFDCSDTTDPVPNWYSNAFQALADDDTMAQYVNQALQAVASLVAQWASQGVSPSGAVQQGASNIW